MSNCYNFYMVNKNNKLCLCCCFCLNHITIVAMDIVYWKTFLPLLMGCVLYTFSPLLMGCILCTVGNYADPLTELELFDYYLTLAMSCGQFCMLLVVVSSNVTPTNDSIFHMSDDLLYFITEYKWPSWKVSFRFLSINTALLLTEKFN